MAIGDVLSVNSGASSGGEVIFPDRVPWTARPADHSGFRVMIFSWPSVPNSLEAGAWLQSMLQSARAEVRVRAGLEKTIERVAEVAIPCP